jgi:hypothetical protein
MYFCIVVVYRMSFLNSQLRDFIIKSFMGEQVSIRPRSMPEESELDTFIEMPNVNHEISNPEIAPIHKFKYLEDDVLSKEFALQREPDIVELKKHTIQLCIFNVNESLKTPFLEFFFENKTGEFGFPSKELDMSILAEIYNKEKSEKININNTAPFQIMGDDTQSESSEDDQEDGFDEFEEAFFKQCSQLFQDITFYDDNIARQRYLGFIEKEDIIYIVFDCTDLDILENVHLQKKDGHFIAIIDEILNMKKINATPIEEKIIKMFESMPLLCNIYGQDNKPKPSPKLVNLCIQGESGYKNEYYENEKDISDTFVSRSQSQSVSMVNPKVNHPLFNNIYLFTTEPFVTTSQKGIMQEAIQTVKTGMTVGDEINNIKRYALELGSVKYYKDVDIKTLIEKQEQINPNYDVYCFYDNGREFWAVKSVKSFIEI